MCLFEFVTSSTKYIYKIPTNDTMPPFGLQEGRREFQGCLYSDCYYTENPNLLDSVELYDAILFSVPSFRLNDVSILNNLNFF